MRGSVSAVPDGEAGVRGPEPAEAVLRDGAVLRADLYRPPPTVPGPWPVLLARCPYGRRDPGILDRLRPRAAAARGYLVVIQDTRGRFGSGGEWEPLVHEYDDGYDTVRWAARLPGCDGRVAMYGPSYLGHTQWAAIAAGAPELVAAVPGFTWADPYDGLLARGGARELGLLAQWSLGLGEEVLRRRYAAGSGELSRALAELADSTGALGSRVHWELPADDLPSLRRLALPVPGRPGGPPVRDTALADVGVPTLTVAGWYDVFLQGSLDNYRRTRAAGRPAALIVGPWTHDNQTRYVGELDFGARSAAESLDGGRSLAARELDWLDARLAEREAGAAVGGRPSASPAGSPLAPEPAEAESADPTTGPAGADAYPVNVFVMGVNRWLPLADWPPPATETAWYLHPGGGLAPAPPPVDGDAGAAGVIRHSGDDPAPVRGGALLLADGFPAGPYDQRAVERRPDVLVYTGAPLTRPLAVVGRIRAVLVVTADAPGADWVVRLCDVGPDGVSYNLADGIARAGHAPCQAREVAVDLWSTAHVLLPGHRLRVQVAAAGFPRWDRSPAALAGPVTQTVHHTAARPSRLLLPRFAGTGAGPPALTG
ncbi:CocE/NonD family hydrolase [Streptomyces sp. CA-111067]|uniref:CocE/NonD family hydrolase n=1 Tax=Streptomyces sp. CA-111067 TaxID=3240046 RepID=UPI003D957746